MECFRQKRNLIITHIIYYNNNKRNNETYHRHIIIIDINIYFYYIGWQTISVQNRFSYSYRTITIYYYH